MKRITSFVLLLLTMQGWSEEEKEWPPYDGWYNNLAHPEWGVVDSPLTRRLPHHYEDGVYQPSGWTRPNPRSISEMTMKGLTGKGSYQNKTALLVFFGQQVVEEVLDAQRPGCPVEYFNIKIPEGDPDYKTEKEIPFVRSRYDQRNTGFSPNNPRQQLNEITPFIDGGLTYGVSKAWVDGLRLFKTECPNRGTGTTNIFDAGATNSTDCRGELASLDDEGRFPIRNNIGLPLANPPPPRDHELKSAQRFFRLGNPRGNENPFLLTFGVMWFRHHNYLARMIRERHSDWSDERVFNEARALNIAIHQKIVLYDWLPIFLGACDLNRTDDTVCEDVTPYEGYKPSIHPGITHVFQSAAMRFGHTLVPPGVFRRSKYNNSTGTCEFFNTTLATAGGRHEFQQKHVGKPALRTCNTYWNPTEAIEESDISPILMGLASQICEREDNVITPDLRGSVFGPLEFSRRDLMAINIQRGRDHGLPDYNTARVALGLKRKNSFYDVNPDLFQDPERNGPEVLKNFEDVHENNIDNVDIWTGGLLETTPDGPGELFRYIIRDQFLRIRDGDRFWYENRDNGLFNDEDIEFIKNTTIREVILRTNPDMGPDDIQNQPFLWKSDDARAFCGQTMQLSEFNMENCTENKSFDYFTGSEVSYILTFICIGLFIIGVIVLLLGLGKRSDRMRIKMRKQVIAKKKQTQQLGSSENIFVANEVLGKSNKTCELQICLGPGKTIQIKTGHGSFLRTIDLANSSKTIISETFGGGGTIAVIRVENDVHDLVLQFGDHGDREVFLLKMRNFLEINGQQVEVRAIRAKEVMDYALTKEMRDHQLQKFFKAALATSLKLGTSTDEMNAEISRKYIHVELNKKEFADQLKLKPNSLFVDQMFEIADADNNGRISFREFLDIMVLFSKGSPEDKSRLMFNMYDLDKSGKLSRDEFRIMLKSMMEMVGASIETEQISDVVNSMMTKHGFENKTELTPEDFQVIMQQYSTELGDASLNIPGEKETPQQQGPSKAGGRYAHKNTVISRARKTVKIYKKNTTQSPTRSADTRKSKVHVIVRESKEEKSAFARKWRAFQKYVQNYRMHIFWLSMYILVTLAIFAERAYYYSIEREHVGLRRIAGYGVSITRGAASAMMFTYSSLLVTMCRNTITLLRETFLHRYIPFDSAVTMHRIIAWMALSFTLMHIIGHGFNIYAISTQPIGDLMCLFRDYWRTSDTLPKFHYWCWQTITGLTGVFLTLTVATMYVFASDYSRRKVFRWFWWTHNFGYVGLFFFTVLHGSGFLVQRPFFYYFFLGPGILYTLDKLYSISRNKTEISVMKAELLPSDVTYLEFKRPNNMTYQAGQWVRIACLAQSPNEYHPFTLTSAPHEDSLKLHIRAVGPWTMNLRNIYNPEVLRDSAYPKLYLDGPFGEGHQDWYKYEVSVLVGGGIGVTPFASILKDLVQKSASGLKINCKKVYFLWVTRDQKQYEWLTDIIQEVEEADQEGLLDTHIFITQFPGKFDLRTTMLYICERHFQKIAGKSLFTGLRAITHFGRPDFQSYLQSLAEEHNTVEEFGVFSCGPPPMTLSVDSACATMNKFEGPSYTHHFENF